MYEQCNIVCVYLPRFHWQMLMMRKAQLGACEQDILITTPAISRNKIRKIIETSPKIPNVLIGAPLYEALSNYPNALVMEADIPYSKKLVKNIINKLQDVVLNVEKSDSGHIFLDIDGLNRLYGDDSNIVRLISNSVLSIIPNIDIRIGIGSSKWIAQMAASLSKKGRAYKVSGNPKNFLSRLSISTLPISQNLMERLQSFGLETMGEIASLTKESISAQFGKEGAKAWDLSNGIDEGYLLSYQSEKDVSEFLEFPHPTVNIFTILAAIDRLLSIAYSRPILRNRYVRRCLIESRITGLNTWVVRTAFKEPAGSKDYALFALKSKLDTLQIPGPLMDIKLTLSGLVSDVSRQESIWPELQRSKDLSQTLEQLQDRIGKPPPIYRFEKLNPKSNHDFRF